MKGSDIKDGYYVVGKLRNDTRPGRATTRLAQFSTAKAAGAYISNRAKLSKREATDVAEGKYTIDGPCRRKAKS